MAGPVLGQGSPSARPDFTRPCWGNRIRTREDLVAALGQAEVSLSFFCLQTSYSPLSAKSWGRDAAHPVPRLVGVVLEAWTENNRLRGRIDSPAASEVLEIAAGVEQMITDVSTGNTIKIRVPTDFAVKQT